MLDHVSITDTGNDRDVRAPGLAALAGLVADETRAACLLALLDGRAWTAGELARHAGVAPSTLSEHLGKLVAGGLLAEERQGRHRYVRLADTRVAQLVEDLAVQVAPPAAHRPRTLRAASAGSAMARGRTCYDHLAGRLGIAVTDALTAQGLLSAVSGPEGRIDGARAVTPAVGGAVTPAVGGAVTPPVGGAVTPASRERATGFLLTEAGLRWFEGTGITLDRAARRPLARACLDWTERRPHLAGAAGAALCRHALDAGWCVRIGSERAVKVTATGERALADLLGIEAAALR
ncbi:ArsR/SmtB family transcription factor [Streptomyces rishiriensis]|uniref:DNA-binding transcriptional ArsR family regulator n=1 Tax=Streptomyces rishiriensis TaxID=68264 RepID=A0ABU0NLK9_STRRH|nr:winged helix-turn-helix domain-containing protein [Streptomyces rishiriensis]MDQ0580011.1 DNA-binding transcriptional ArsR family regulator [Streptomyces rishiriensis]